MDYEKLYKESLERAKKLHKDAITLQLEQDIKDYEYIFPELKESEDERIRGAIIEHLKDNDLIEWAAWLEKQGEKKPTDKVEPKFKIGATIIKKHNSDINDFGQFTITDITGGKYWYNDRIICNIKEQDEWEIYEPVEQKPAWNEEDENKVTLFMQLTEGCDNEEELADWLKSLKERIKPKWKPSEEHISRLETAINYLDSIRAESSKIVLTNLLEQLKKL